MKCLIKLSWIQMKNNNNTFNLTNSNSVISNPWLFQTQTLFAVVFSVIYSQLFLTQLFKLFAILKWTDFVSLGLSKTSLSYFELHWLSDAM